jgi:hypothetical protein
LESERTIGERELIVKLIYDFSEVPFVTRLVKRFAESGEASLQPMHDQERYWVRSLQFTLSSTVWQ